jgi:hypothetical protein
MSKTPKTAPDSALAETVPAAPRPNAGGSYVRARDGGLTRTASTERDTTEKEA